jgi:hypothetical protein
MREIMGEWMEAYIEGKDAEPNYLGDGKSSLRKCSGLMDRKGKCGNTFRSIGRIFCDECRRYYDSGEWKKENK